VNSLAIARDTIEAALRAGVRDFVVCAGARNAALVEVLAQLQRQWSADRLSNEALPLHLWRHFEERCAGFFALGRCIDTGRPCAVITTSGTAVAELLPAMIEAHYQQRPLLAITADRPAAYRGSGAPQAIEQVDLFLPFAACGVIDAWSRQGPWQCNVELEEEFRVEPVQFPTEMSAPAPSHPALAVGALARWLREDNEGGLVALVGGLEPEEQEEVWHFLDALRIPVLADATSGLREALDHLGLPDGDRLLRKTPPKKVLRIGDVPTGRFWRDLEDLPETEVWSITRSGFSGLARESRVARGLAHRVIKSLGHQERVGDPLELLPRIARRAAQIDEALESLPESEPGWMRTLSHYGTLANSLFLGNSLPIREWNWFAQHQRAVSKVRANRGANGIDGQISTWLGCTAAEENAWCIIGDLTALYDLAAPFLLLQCEQRGRVLVILNNRGGRIFERLPRLRQMDAAARELMIHPHEHDFRHWAAQWGLDYVCANTLDDLDAFEPGDRMTVLEVRPDERQTAEFWQLWDRFDA
jgi:2-succinyl-5-enolpyruvyl-6-hydroxy-3-cyclohexene-1-carboxylate synthase